MKQKKVRRRWTLCVILAILIGLIAALAFWQRNNIKAVKDFATYTQEELEEQLAQNDQQIKDTVEALPEVSVREVTEEERQALRDGTMTEEELADRLLGIETEPDSQVTEDPVGPEAAQPAVSTPAKDSEPEAKPPVTQPNPQETIQTKPEVQPEKAPEATPEQQKPAEQKPANETYQKALSALIAKVYVLREEYLIALDNLQAAATADYKAMAKEERSGSKLADFVSGYLVRGTALEKECDRRMDTIVVAMEKLIKENNGDMSLVDTVITTYANEKSLKKAWYMSELEKKGLI